MSVPATAREFIELVRKSGLVEAPDLARVPAAPEAPARDAAETLVRDGLLTNYQAGLLLKGKWRNFVVAGKYKVLEHLGTGGMGSVYLCEHTVMRRRVALKVLPNKGGPTAAERFKREARAAAALDHPNIVRAHDIDSAGPLTFLVMEYIDGRSLQAVVARSGPLSIERACHYVAQAALGLQHAHEAGLVHRDIKPGNLLLARDGTVKVLDMGLARFTENDDGLTREHEANVVLGTADYLAPEQALNSSDVDIRADIYSLGATLYFLLTGKSPVGDGTLTQKLIRHQIRRVPSVREVRPDVPAALETVLEKMLAKEPGNRYRTPIEVADALLPWTQKPVPPPSPEEMPPVSAEARRAEASSRAPDVTRPMAASSAHAARSSLARAAVGAALPAARKAKPHGLLVAVVLTFILGGTAVAGGLYLLGVPLWDPVPAFTPTGFHPYLLRQLTGHDAGVDRVAVLPDGVSALSVGFDHTVRLWDLDKPALLHVFRDHTAPVRFVCADPTGPRAATGSGDGTVRIWDLKERKLIRTLNSHGGTVWAVGFSPDGKRLASAGDDRKIRLWDTNSGELIKEMTGHSDNINWLVYMPNGKQVATFSWDKTARLWDLESGKDIRKFVAHTARITCGAVTADGKRLATGGDDKIVRVWDPNTGRLEWEQEGPGGLWALAFTPDGRVLAGAGPEKQIRTYDVAAGRVITTWTAHPNGAVAGLSWRLDSQQLVSASHDKTLCVWQAAAAPPKSPWAVVREVAGPVTPPGRARRAGRPSPRCPGAPTNRRRVPRRGRRAVGN